MIKQQIEFLNERLEELEQMHRQFDHFCLDFLNGNIHSPDIELDISTQKLDEIIIDIVGLDNMVVDQKNYTTLTEFLFEFLTSGKIDKIEFTDIYPNIHLFGQNYIIKTFLLAHFYELDAYLKVTGEKLTLSEKYFLEECEAIPIETLLKQEKYVKQLLNIMVKYRYQRNNASQKRLELFQQALSLYPDQEKAKNQVCLLLLSKHYRNQLNDINFYQSETEEQRLDQCLAKRLQEELINGDRELAKLTLLTTDIQYFTEQAFSDALAKLANMIHLTLKKDPHHLPELEDSDLLYIHLLKTLSIAYNCSAMGIITTSEVENHLYQQLFQNINHLKKGLQNSTLLSSLILTCLQRRYILTPELFSDSRILKDYLIKGEQHQIETEVIRQHLIGEKSLEIDQLQFQLEKMASQPTLIYQLEKKNCR